MSPWCIKSGQQLAYGIQWKGPESGISVYLTTVGETSDLSNDVYESLGIVYVLLNLNCKDLIIHIICHWVSLPAPRHVPTQMLH